MAFTCCYFLLTDNFSITFLVIHNFIRHCYCKETTAITSNNVHWSTKGSFFHYLKKSAAYFFLIALFHSHNLFWEETIKSAHQRIRVVHENFLQSLILQAFVNITQFEWSRQPSQRRPGTAKFWQSQRVFHQLLRFENTVIRGSRRPGEWSKPDYSFGDQFWVRVLQINFLQSSILHAFVNITHLQRSRQLERKWAWYS